MAIPFEPTGVLLSDLESCVTNTTAMHITYTDRDGVTSDRVIAPVEVRGDGVYLFSLEKNGEPDAGHGSGDSRLRFFLLSSIGSFEVIDRQFDPSNFKT